MKTFLDEFMSRTDTSAHMVEEAFSVETIVVPAEKQHSHYKTTVTVLLSPSKIHRLKAYTKERRAQHLDSIRNDLPNYDRAGISSTVSTMVNALENEETAIAFETLVTSFMNDFTKRMRYREGHWSLRQWVRWTNMEVDLFLPISYMHNQHHTNPIDIDYGLFYQEDDEAWHLNREDAKRARYSHMFSRVKAWFDSFKAQKRFVKVVYDFT